MEVWGRLRPGTADRREADEPMPAGVADPLEPRVGKEFLTWRRVLDRARPGRWVAQQYFAAETDAHGAAVNYGVFLVAGRAAGLYARVAVGATDGSARSVAALVGT